MQFASGETVVRERRKPKPSPYNPQRTIPGAWEDELDTLELESVFVGSTSSSALPDATREERQTSKSLYCTNTAVDVRAGDRIRRGGTKDDSGAWSGGEFFYVLARPEADTNPFTGWSPVVEIPMSMTEG